MGVLRWLAGFLATAIALAILATIAQTGFVLGMLIESGAQIGVGDALFMIFWDLRGLGLLYGAILAAGLLVAFLAAAGVVRLIGSLRAAMFAAAGAVCVAVALALMEQVFFGVQLIAGARTFAGFAVQCLAGAAAGLLFAALTPPPARRA